MVPRPPKRLVPPITAAAIALSTTSPLPEDWFTASRREAARIPPQAARVADSVNTRTRTRSTAMPARRAASALPPTAKTCRPQRVRVVTASKTTTKPSRISIASGTPRPASRTAMARRIPPPTRTIRATSPPVVPTPSPAAARRRRARERLARKTRTATIPTSQPRRGPRKVPARFVIAGSVRLTVPVSPSTQSSRPCQPRRPARVTTNEGTRKRVIQTPWRSPMPAPARTPTPTARAPGRPALTLSTAMTAAQSPLTAPTDRSISPSSRTSTTPTEIVPMAAIWRTRLVRLRGVRKLPFSDWKTMAIRISAATTGSEPISPWETRRPNPSRVPASPGRSAISRGSPAMVLTRRRRAPASRTRHR